MLTPRKTEKGSRGTGVPGLRQRLIVSISIPLILILTIALLLDYRLARKTSDSAHDQALSDTVFDLESHLRQHPAAQKLDFSDEANAVLRSNAPAKVFFSIRDEAGRLLTGDADIPIFAMPAKREMVFHDSEFRGEKVRVALHSVAMAPDRFLITVMETTEKRSQSRQRILAAVLLPNLAIIVATLLAVLFGVRQGLLPLDDMEREIAARSPNDLREIDLATSPREIQPALRRLNELFKLLRQASEAQNRFIGDAAHQLRTPLAGLQTQLDLAVSEGAFTSNEQRLQNIEEGTERLRRLLGQLLSHARADPSASISEKKEPVRLSELAEKSASRFLDAALSKDIDLGFEIQPATISGHYWMLEEALANLIDNAIRYVPPAGIITVRCGTAGDTAFLEVEDNGPGIDEALRNKVLERFYRIPGSPSNGCGLGLSIVKEIAEIHQAELRLASGDMNGLCIRLVFARLDDPAIDS